MNISSDQVDSHLYHQQLINDKEIQIQNTKKTHRSKSNKKSPNGYSNGYFVISRDDALILLPDGGKHSLTTDGFTFIKSAKNSDTENSDVEVSIYCTDSIFLYQVINSTIFSFVFVQRAIILWISI